MKSSNTINSLNNNQPSAVSDATPSFKTTQDQIKYLENQLQELNEAKKKWANMEDIYDSLLKKNQEAIDQSKADILNKDKTIETLTEEINRLKIIIEEQRKNILDFSNDNSSLKKAAESNQQSILNQQNKIEEQEKNFREKIEKLKQENDTEQKKLNDNLASISFLAENEGKKTRELGEKHSNLLQKNNKLILEATESSKKIKALELQQKELEQKNKKLNDQLNEQQFKSNEIIKGIRGSLEKAENENKQKAKIISNGEDTINTLNLKVETYEKTLKERNATIASQADTNRKLTQENSDLGGELKFANAKIYSITNQHKELSLKNKSSIEAIQKLAQEKEENEIKIEKRINYLDKMQIVKIMFSKFVDAYVERNKSFGFFSLHGKTGIIAAREFEMEFNLNKETITSQKQLREYLRDLKTENPKLLAGNYHADSFKTYLLAYYKYVDELDMNEEIPYTFDIVDYVQSYAARAVSIEQQYTTVFKPVIRELRCVVENI